MVTLSPRWRRFVVSASILVIGFVFAVTAAPTPAAAFDGSWQAVSSTGSVPVARRDLGAIYDKSRDRVVVLAGDGRTWTRDLGAGAWVQLATAPFGPSTGFERAVYDADGDRMVVIDSNMQIYTLALSNPVSWVLQATTGTQPPARAFFAVTYDELRGRVLLYGGGPYTGVFNDLWALTLGSPMQWTRIQPGGIAPVGSWGPIAVYDPSRDQVVVGLGSTTTGYDTQNRLWRVSLSGSQSWEPLYPTGTTPSARMVSAAVYDPGDDAVVLFGGYPGTGTDTWELKLAGVPAWVGLTPLNSPPSSRWSAAAMIRGGTAPAMILYGGFNGGAALSDLWLLSRAVPGVVEGPVLQAFAPLGGIVGDPVTLTGARMADVTLVSFHGVPAVVEHAEYSFISTRVPAGATTGPISITSPAGSATSLLGFFVGEVPLIQSATPDSGRTGEAIQLAGAHFTGATSVRIGASGPLAFTVVSDIALTVVLDSTVSTGSVAVTTPAAVGTSAFLVRRVVDNPKPLLHYVRDVRGDQGGRVLLSWQASDLDRAGRRTISGYRVWRRGQAPVQAARGEALPAGWMSRPVEGAGAQAPPLEYWEALATLPAAFLAGYAYTADTPRDSTDGDPAWTAFFVQALTSDIYTFYNSVVDSGYSVDNLAPPTPTPFAVVYAPTGNALHWRGRPVADLRGYEIHRGSSPTFVPSAATLVVTTRDTAYADAPGGDFYKLAAVDVHGNRSRFVSASPGQPVATLASFVSADRDAQRIALTWYSGGNPGLEVMLQRRTTDTDWLPLRAILADGDGYLRFEDSEVTENVRYGYRLVIVEPDGTEMALGETWVDPVRTSFAVLGTGANPSRDGRVSMAFALPLSASADVRLFDIAGREVDRRELTGGAGSSQSVEFGSSVRLRAGVYLVRATSGPVMLTRRVVVLN